MKRAQFRITLWVPVPGQQSLNHRHLLSGKSSACHCRGFLPTAPWEWAGRSARLVVEHGILVTPSVWLSEEDGAKWELGDDPGTLQRNGPVAQLPCTSSSVFYLKRVVSELTLTNIWFCDEFVFQHQFIKRLIQKNNKGKSKNFQNSSRQQRNLGINLEARIPSSMWMTYIPSHLLEVFFQCTNANSGLL